jgi:PAS domain S-box-containing protein
MASAQILVVEDEGTIAKSIEHELTSMGYGIAGVASSGEEALRKAEETFPDLVLMDMVLKGDMDGVEATEQLQERFDIPVVYLTAYADDDTLQRAKTTQPYGYLVKPYEEKELRTTIEIALYKHRIEAMAKEMQRWRSAILRSIGDGVIVTDAKGRIRLANRVAEKLTGWRDDEAFGQDLAGVLHLIDEKTRAVRNFPAAKPLPKGSSVDLEQGSLLVSKSGKEIPIEGTMAPVYDQAEDFTGYVLTFRDITERRHAEAADRKG